MGHKRERERKGREVASLHLFEHAEEREEREDKQTLESGCVKHVAAAAYSVTLYLYIYKGMGTKESAMIS